MRRLRIAAIALMGGVACEAADEASHAAWRVEPTPAVAIGDLDGRPEYSFYRIAGVTSLADGRIVVADGASAELRIFSPAGRLVQTIGRRGSGPAEFDFVFRMDRTPGDTLVVLAVAVSDDRIYAGDTGSDSVFVYSVDGALSAVWKLPLTAKWISPAARSIAEPTPHVAGDGSVRRFPPYDYPEFYPAFARLVADLQGNLWVMRYPEAMEPVTAADFMVGTSKAVPAEGAEWLILDQNGEVVATATTPPGLHVLEIGSDYVLGTARDEYDVESVRMHRLTR